MVKTTKPRRRIAITCSFSLPPELRPQLEYIQMTKGLSEWIQEQFSQMDVDDVLTSQYSTIKDIVDKHQLFVRHLGMNERKDHHKYDFIIHGLGKTKNTSIALDIGIKKGFVGNAREEYGLVLETVNEIKSQGFNIELC